MGIKRSTKKGKKKKLGSLRGSGSSSSSTEQSTRRPKFVEKTPPCSAECPQGTDIRGILTKIAQDEKAGRPHDETFREAFEMLTEKTRGNLTDTESKLLESILYELHRKFVEAGR